MGDKKDVNFREIPLKDLRLYRYNPRSIDSAELYNLKNSILKDPEFLTQRPLLVNETSEGFFIYAGHQRYKALLELGRGTAPCLVSKDLPEDQLKTRMLKDNMHYGDWDQDKLSTFDVTVLKELKLDNFDYTVQGTSKERTAEQKASSGNAPAKKPVYRLYFQSKKERDAFAAMVKKIQSFHSNKPLFSLLTDAS